MVIWVKLTQGTGRGTCWWSKFIYLHIILIHYKTLYFKVLESLINSLVLFLNVNSAFDHMLTIFMMYSFLKLLLLSSLLELIWPTHFFNKRHNFNSNSVKNRNFLEIILKIRSVNVFRNILNTFLVKYYLL